MKYISFCESIGIEYWDTAEQARHAAEFYLEQLRNNDKWDKITAESVFWAEIKEKSRLIKKTDGNYDYFLFKEVKK